MTGSYIYVFLLKPRWAPLEQNLVFKVDDSSPFFFKGKTLSRKRSFFSGLESKMICYMSSSLYTYPIVANFYTNLIYIVKTLQVDT